MKTIKQWLEELPEPYRSAAIRNTRKEVFENPEGFPVQMIDGAFCWADTPEGYGFWRDVHYCLRDGRPLPPYPAKAHPHAESMRLYAEDAAETDKPWERWEIKIGKNVSWEHLTTSPAWSSSVQYRRKVKTIRIGDYDVPEPCREPLKAGQEYWYTDLFEEEGVARVTWENDELDMRFLNRGMIHLTREAAETHAKAIISFTERKESV